MPPLAPPTGEGPDTLAVRIMSGRDPGRDMACLNAVCVVKRWVMDLVQHHFCSDGVVFIFILKRFHFFVLHLCFVQSVGYVVVGAFAKGQQ